MVVVTTDFSAVTLYSPGGTFDQAAPPSTVVDVQEGSGRILNGNIQMVIIGDQDLLGFFMAMEFQRNMALFLGRKMGLETIASMNLIPAWVHLLKPEL